jgi:hypothetical protein
MSAFIKLRFRFARGQSVLLLIVLGLALLTATAHATRRTFTLPDGIVTTIDITTNQTVVTLTGQSSSVYRLECSENLLQWTVLHPAMRLGAAQTFTYTDSRALPKCFYRIAVLAAPPQ